MKHWKYRTHITGWIACLALLMQVTGCARSELGAGEGAISFSFAEDDAVRVKSPDAIRTDVGYTLDIVDQKGDTVAHYDDHRTVRSIKLKEGVYTVHAEDNTETPETSKFGEPRYGGTQSVTVTAGQNTPVLMTCKLINVKVTVTEFEQEIKDNFPEYSLVIKPTEDYTGHDTLTFTQAEVDAGQEGWINQTKRGTFVLIFRAVNKQSPDKRQIYIRTIADAEPADFYRLAVTMNPIGDQSDGGAMIRLSVKTDNKEYEFPFGVKDHTRPVPVVSRADGGSIREPLMTNVDLRNGQIRLNVHADAGMQRLRIRHEDAAVLLKYGLPGMINLGGDNDMATDEAQRAGLSGVVTWGDGSIVGETDTWVDFSGLMNTAAVDGALLPEGIYTVDIEVYDFDNQLVTHTVNLSVARDFATGGALSTELVGGFPGVGAKYAYVTAKWLGSATPTGLGFQYRVMGSGDDAWVTVSVKTADIDEAQKSFRGYLSGLTPETFYEFRPVGDGLAPGSAAVFTTDVLTELPNLDFEGGSTGSFDGANGVYDPNIPGQARFWATGNPGGKFTILGIGLDKNVTLPVTGDEARTGTSLWMTSYYVSKAGVTSLASGSIFSGTFGPITSAPTNSAAQRALVHYGQTFASRPLALKGWYKYIPKTIDTDIDGKYPEMIGQMDKCKIYISLEAWGNGVSSRPANPTVVGYGELLSGATPTDSPEALANNGYVPFEFRITYDPDHVVKPDHIVMCASCSYLSDQFCGGAGSSLYIDDFEIIWEPSQLAGQ